ncbi:hypothetical protein [Prevotella sp. OH937_COT-195]|uniref:hypothetical protein n=1 Tax=Prevotella sp. OH937_COT-195 TaxID=2491051 RepID=UPI0018F39DE2|nr:hypothetical protein [Prevotella sp. OH937_COT-195]
MQPFHLDVARYAFDETAAHLLNNRTKSVEGSNDRFGFKKRNKMFYRCKFKKCVIKELYTSMVLPP